MIKCGSDRIGDALQGLLVVGDDTYLVPPHLLPWVALFDVNATTTAPEGVEPVNVHRRYALQVVDRLTVPRWERYSEQTGNPVALPTPRPIPADVMEWVEPFRGKVVLCPFASDPLRVYPHWWQVELLLWRSPGTVILGGADDEPWFLGTKLLGLEPVKVAAVMSVAGVVLTGDTGLAHLAGLLGAPTVVLGGVVDPQRVYGAYPSVRVLPGHLRCGNCHRQPSAGYSPDCERRCAYLDGIRPAEVVEIARLLLT